MEQMTNASEPSPSSIHHVLKLQLIGMDVRKTFPVVTRWQGPVERGIRTAEQVLRDMSKLAVRTLTQRAVLPHIPNAEMLWWRFLVQT